MNKPIRKSSSQTFAAQHWLKEHGSQMAEAMFPDGSPPDDFDVNILVQTSDRLVMRVNAGEHSAVLKAFNSQVERATAARYREIAVLLALTKTDLIPSVLAYNRTSNWILSDFIDGRGLGDVIDETNAVHYAKSVGEWYAKYTDVLTSQSECQDTNWYAYLDKYKMLTKRADYGDHRKLLERLPISQRIVAKNDAYLQNFLVDCTDTLVGIDFEKAQLKPYGWDILITARLLVKMFPHLFLELTEALVEGWGRGTDVICSDDFLLLIQTFASTTAFTLKHPDKAKLRAQLGAFNALSGHHADRIQETPYSGAPIVDQPSKNSALLLAYLNQLPKEGTTDAPAEAKVVVKLQASEALFDQPTSGESAFCGTCQGSCCKQGADKMAFLRPAVVEQSRVHLNLATNKETIQRYMDLIPKQHVQGSCIFHTAQGCNIPRPLRSDTCNSYRCHALNGFLTAAEEADGPISTLLFTGDETGVTRARLITENSVEDVSHDSLALARVT